MNLADALITVGLFLAASGIAGLLCVMGDRRLQKRQQDWTSEAGGRGMR